MDEETIDYLRDYYKLSEKVSDQYIVDNFTDSLGYDLFRLEKAKSTFSKVVKREIQTLGKKHKEENQ